MEKFSFKNEGALTSVAQLVGHHPEKQGVMGLIPSQGTCLGCGPGPQLGVYERQPHIDVSLPLCFFLSPLLKRNKIFKIFFLKGID